MIGRAAGWLTIGLSLAVLAGAALWLWAEAQWATVTDRTPEDAFVHGTIGLEAFPLKYAAVMQTLSADSFFAEGAEGDIWRDYGFVTQAPIDVPACVSNVADWAPVGVGVSNYVPVTAMQTPTLFAGLTCAACHSSRLRLPDGSQGPVIHGTGNQELDVIAWSDGVRNAILDPRLTVDAIMAAYDAQCDDGGGVIAGLIDRVVIDGWLSGAKAAIGGDLAKYDLPFDNAAIRDPQAIPAGPGRTRPFRSVVRVSLDLSAADNFALSKIPVVWEQRQDLRPASQYDGSIRSPVTRSLIAAYASGASQLALSKPEVAANVRAAAAFTEGLNLSGPPIPAFSEYFDVPEPAAVARGFGVYMERCNGCHGHRPLAGGQWSLDGAGAIHKRLPLTAIGTDAERLVFRYAKMLPLSLQTDFPGWDEDLAKQVAALEGAAAKAMADRKPALASVWHRQLDKLQLLAREHRNGHPLYFPPDDLTAEEGYINNPIPRAWLRAPYLHNGSVPTLAQLIGLEPRPDQFCRGRNRYDPASVGYDAPPPESGICPPETPFLFDTSARGNSNVGHNYPWAYDNPNRDEAALRDLLAYLTTL